MANPAHGKTLGICQGFAEVINLIMLAILFPKITG
jgi:hypothetical protein